MEKTIKNTSIRETDNPNRSCIKCGVTGNNHAIRLKDGRIKYQSYCRACIKKDLLSKSFNVCQNCFKEKQTDFKRECKACLKERELYGRSKIVGEDLLKIKKWVKRQIMFGFMTNMKGINELITYYQLVCRAVTELDLLPSGQQLQKMWEILYKMYNEELKDIPDDVLVTLFSDRTTKQIKNKNIILNTMTNDDFKKIEEFLGHIENIKIDGKEYNLKNEYNLCTMGNKSACKRFRRILVTLRVDIKDLKEISFKYGKATW